VRVTFPRPCPTVERKKLKPKPLDTEKQRIREENFRVWCKKHGYINEKQTDPNALFREKKC